MATSTDKKSDTNIDLAAIKEHVKQANDFLQRYESLLTEWTASNDSFKSKMRKMIDENKKHIEKVNEVLSIGLSSTQLKNVDSACKVATPVVTSQAPATVAKQLSAFAEKRKTSGETLATATKRPLQPSNEQKSKRAKIIADEKMAAIGKGITGNKELDKKADEGKETKTEVKKYPKPFVLLSPMDIKKENNEEVIVLNSKRAGKMTFSVATGLVCNVKPMVKPTKSRAELIMEKAKQNLKTDVPKMDWNPIVSSTPNMSSDTSKIESKNPLKIKKNLTGLHRMSLRGSAENVTQRNKSIK